MSISLSSVQFSSVSQLYPTLCNPMECSTPDFPVHHQLPELTQMHIHSVGDAIQPSHPLSFLCLLPSIFPRIRVFSDRSVFHSRWPEYWSFSFSISPSCEYSGLISCRMDWYINTNRLKLQYFGPLMQRVDSLEKTLMLGGIRAGGEGDNRG